MNRRAATICLVLVVSLTLAAPCHETAEICIGLDGHVGLKADDGAASCHSECQPCEGAGERAGLLADDGHEHPHGACFDLPLRPGLRDDAGRRLAGDGREPFAAACFAADTALPMSGQDIAVGAADRPELPPDPPRQPYAARCAALLI